VGFLRYWTVSNIPLFLLASPMLAILIESSLWTMRSRGTKKAAQKTRLTNSEPHGDFPNTLLYSLAVPQLVLAILALTSYHVQIITRISSGYCIWYFWLSSLLIDASNGTPLEKNSYGLLRWLRVSPATVVKYLMMYALIQGGLYASFLPPA
jgi:GPI mannosyltransferase 2